MEPFPLGLTLGFAGVSLIIFSGGIILNCGGVVGLTEITFPDLEVFWGHFSRLGF